MDGFDQPQYSGGYAELIRAFMQADLKANKIIAYCKVVNNTAVTKRIGFLSELFECNHYKNLQRLQKNK